MRPAASTRLSLALLALSLGCERSPPPSARPRTSAPVAPPKVGVTTLSSNLARAAAPTVIAIGDLHGDLDATRRALRLSGAIDGEDRWVGGSLVVVQTGDVIDRGDQDREVLELLEAVRRGAREAGGELILLWGNHELMNALGDLRYVTEGALRAFGGAQARFDAFRPGGRFARLLDERRLVAKVGDTLFAHGGILPQHVEYGLDRMNDELHAFLRGQRAEPPLSAVAEDGVLWTRAYSVEQPACAALSEVLARLGARRMVVGHTVQSAGANAACDGKVFRIDTGMSRFYGGQVQVLELRDREARVRRED